jgi:hypothetical protein
MNIVFVSLLFNNNKLPIQDHSSVLFSKFPLLRRPGGLSTILLVSLIQSDWGRSMKSHSWWAPHVFVTKAQSSSQGQLGTLGLAVLPAGTRQWRVSTSSAAGWPHPLLLPHSRLNFLVRAPFTSHTCTKRTVVLRVCRLICVWVRVSPLSAGYQSSPQFRVPCLCGELVFLVAGTVPKL